MERHINPGWAGHPDEFLQVSPGWAGHLDGFLQVNPGWAGHPDGFLQVNGAKLCMLTDIFVTSYSF